MIPGIGYAVTEAQLHLPGGTGTANFVGESNTGDVPVNIFHNPSNPVQLEFNRKPLSLCY